LKLSGLSRRIIGMCYDVGPIAGSNFGLGPNSIMLRVPFVGQKHVNLCSDASAMMILQAWGYPTNRTTKRTPAGAFDSALLSDHTDLVTEARLNGQRGWRLTGGSGTRCADKGEPARQSGPDWLLYRWRPSRDSALRRADRRL
jgi:hypothetical protein